MAIKTLQVTIGASLTRVTTSQAYAKWVVFQNNASNSMRIGDASASSTRGLNLTAAGSFFTPPLSGGQSYLAQWYVAGTQNDILDVIYDEAV